MARLLRLLALAGLEATIVGLPLLALTPFDLPWALLLGAVLLGCLADAIALRLSPQRERAVLLVGAGGAVLLMVGSQLGGPAALLPGAPQFGAAYVMTAAALFLFWRGSRLNVRDSAATGALFGRGAVILLAALLLRPLFRPGATIPVALLGAYVLGFISLGLLSLALAQADDEGVRRRLSGRWLVTLGLAIGGVVLVGGLIAGLLGGGAALGVAQVLLQLALLPFALVGAAMAWLFFTLFAGPLALVASALSAIFDRLPEPPPTPEDSSVGFYNQDPGALITTLATSATWLMALIPLALLVAAILLLRRRMRVRASADEERESLDLAASLAGDLRDLLGRLRNPFAHPRGGLHAALAALGGDDPRTRTRRAYLRMLLDLERRQHPRPPAQTPAEYAPEVSQTVGQAQAVATLTRAYERARYDPTDPQATEAEAAEAALAALAHPPRAQ